MMIIFCIRLVACTALWNNYAIIAMVWNSTKMSEEEGEGERQRIFDSLKKVHQWAAILVQKAHSQRIYVGKHNPINVNCCSNEIKGNISTRDNKIIMIGILKL